jgi:hypothetical protein
MSRNQRLPAYLVQRQPAFTAQAIGFHLDVEAHFIVHLNGDTIGAGQGPPVRADPRGHAPAEVFHLRHSLLVCQGETNMPREMFPGGSKEGSYFGAIPALARASSSALRASSTSCRAASRCRSSLLALNL